MTDFHWSEHFQPDWGRTWQLRVGRSQAVIAFVKHTPATGASAMLAWDRAHWLDAPTIDDAKARAEFAVQRELDRMIGEDAP